MQCRDYIITSSILSQAGKLTVINSLTIYLKSMYSKPPLALFMCIMLTVYTFIIFFVFSWENVGNRNCEVPCVLILKGHIKTCEVKWSYFLFLVNC